MKPETIGEALSELKRRAAISLSAIAKAAEYSGPSSVQAFFHPDYNPPALDVSVAHRLATALEGRGTPPIQPEEIFALSRVGFSRSLALATSVPKMIDEEGQITVYETRHGGRQGWRRNSILTTLEFFSLNMSRRAKLFPAQPGIRGGSGAFSLYVAGNSMSPRFKDGEPIFIDPTRSPSRGEDAIVVLKNTTENTEANFENAILGLLIRRDADDVVLRQHKPARAARVPTSEVASVLRVYPWAEVTAAAYA